MLHKQHILGKLLIIRKEKEDMKTDARVRYTRKVIRENFMELLKEKPVSRITVKEICERSEINRATFYKHYRDPLDLLEKIEEEMLQYLQETLEHDACRNITSLYTTVLTKIQENGALYRTICSDHGDPGFSVRLFLTSYHKAFPMMSRHFEHLDKSQQKLLYYFIAQGSGGVISYWSQSGMKEPVEQVAQFISETVNIITKNFKA